MVRAMLVIALMASGASAQDPFWTPIDFSGARDLGHRPERVAEVRQSSRLAFVNVTTSARLGEARGGGNTHGVGIAFVDLDGDAFADIFVANGVSNAGAGTFASVLYRNHGNGTFEDVTTSSGVAAILDGRDAYSVAAGDYDGDGDVDLYVGAHPRDVLLRNVGDGTFEDRTFEAGAGGPESSRALASDGRSKIVSFGDYDRDGRLDIVSASSAFLGESNVYLLRNVGSGRFVDVSLQTAIRTHPVGNPCAVLWSDIDNDGDEDLWIWNDRGGHILLENVDAQRFEDVTSGTDASIQHPMGIDGADIDHNGFLDYYVSNVGDHPLLLNAGDGTFKNVTREAGTAGDFGWGLGFEDFDLDGWPDLFVAQEDDRPYLAYRNLGSTEVRFDVQPIEHPPVVSSAASHNVAVAFADYDHDGRTDAVVATTDGTPLVLYRNVTQTGSHRWLEVAVEGGVSARVGVKTGDGVQFRDISGGSSRASQNDLSIRFGLGDWTGAEWVAILWPDGRQTAVTGVAGNQVLRLSR